MKKYAVATYLKSTQPMPWYRGDQDWSDHFIQIIEAPNTGVLKALAVEAHMDSVTKKHPTYYNTELTSIVWQEL